MNMMTTKLALRHVPVWVCVVALMSLSRVALVLGEALDSNLISLERFALATSAERAAGLLVGVGSIASGDEAALKRDELRQLQLNIMARQAHGEEAADLLEQAEAMLNQSRSQSWTEGAMSYKNRHALLQLDGNTAQKAAGFKALRRMMPKPNMVERPFDAPNASPSDFPTRLNISEMDFRHLVDARIQQNQWGYEEAQSRR